MSIIDVYSIYTKVCFQSGESFLQGPSTNRLREHSGNPMSDSGKPQLLHLVLGGELVDFEHATFKDLEKVETVGRFPNYASAHAAWRAKAQQTVDNAHMRYFIVHLHRLLDPSKDAEPILRTFSRR